MKLQRIGQLGGILGKYANLEAGDLSPSLDADFVEVLRLAPGRALEHSIAVTFRSPKTPSFAESLALLYGRANSRRRAELLETIFNVAPELKGFPLDRTPLELPVHIAVAAESRGPSMVEHVSAYCARRPSLLLNLDPASRGMIMTTLARAETRRVAPRATAPDILFGAGDQPDEGPSRKIVVTGHSPSGELVTSFEPETPYALRFRVAARADGNLAQGKVDVTSVPEGGLAARWIVASASVELLTVSPAGKVEKRGDTYVAEFDVTIPGKGDSATVTLNVRTTKVSGELMLTLLVAGKEYRKLAVALGAGAQVKDDVVCTAPGHLNLRTTHEWTTPPEHIEVNVFGQAARVSTIRGTNDYGTVDWTSNSTTLKNPIQRVRNALEKFRVQAEAHLENLSVADMDGRLRQEHWKHDDRWAPIRYAADPAHDQAMQALASGAELRALANEGYRLFETCFPRGSDLRGTIEKLEPGSRIDFVWTSRGAIDWVSHVPWALMYLDAVKSSEPVDCARFLGLRCRIGSKSWEPKAPSRALGDPATVNSLHFLYWGSDPKDQVGVQSLWQRSEFGKWPRQNFVPDPKGADPKQQVVAALETPQPDPAGILYFYCHCSVKDGSDPVLQFGETSKTPDVVEASDIYQGRLDTGPLVFANACTSAASDPQGTSELESRFFSRDIRAFVGTETKVPVALASRFAWLFFQFFLRKADPKPMPAGEALAQARLFLWSQYRNPGGLFYCLVNQYDLYLASLEEVNQLQRK
jgi:CHAT domain